MDIVIDYELTPFEMRVQSLERTLIDKVFAVCDYYLTRKIKRHSRHLYDICMLLNKVSLDDDLRLLIAEVRQERQKMDICLSAKPGVDVAAILHEIIENDVYKEDYDYITSYFQRNPLNYEEAIEALKKVEQSGLF